jgi:hypothetical protein
MCKDATQRTYFETLRHMLTTRFNANLQEYDMLRPHIDKLVLANNAYRGPALEGVISMLTNRINGAYTLYKTPQAFYNAGVSGYKWAYFFSLSPNLQNQVRDAGMAAIYSHLWPLSFTGLAKAAITGTNMAGGSTNELALQAQERVRQQRNSLLVSAGASMGITSMLKKVGSVVQTDMQRFVVRGVMRSWQMTGLLGLCYGLSRLDETMRETGVFGSELAASRDEFLATSPSPLLQQLEALWKSATGR